MKLELVKGSETSLIIDNVDDSIHDNGFLSESYRKAGDVLKDYASRTDKIRREIAKERSIFGVNDCLYRSPQNIIAFSGKRGTGKTSTMLSFSQSLVAEKSKLREEALQNNRGVVVLDPIDPTMLENDQNILNVVLSRLLYKAEEVWKESMDYNRRYQDKEKEKNEILSLAKKCLSGITSIKSRSSMDTLADLQRIGDSAILKRDFYELVELLNRFVLSSVNSASNPLLILQIDDTDCQIGKGYQVMEDIRKYLTIPNVVILMAVDVDMMRLVLTQHYISEFELSLKRGLMTKDDTKHYADKYMSKLLPPMHKIYLPVVDETIYDRGDTIELGYYEAEDVNKENNILERGKSFQTKVLNFIYQKTHLVFVAHDAYLNNIIPTTLRGLTYFLNILSSMDNVPEIDIVKEDDTSELIEELSKQLVVLEKNLDIFENYFMNDWIQAKLSHDMIGIMERVAMQVAEERISYAYEEFLDYYDKRPEKDSTLGYLPVSDPTYYDLDHLLQQILGTSDDARIEDANIFRDLDDFYNIFSIRTLLSIKNNKDVVKIKRRAIKKAQESSEGRLLLDCGGMKLSLPDKLYMDKTVYAKQWIVCGDDEKNYNFTDDILECLCDKTFTSSKLSQKQIFMKQEIAFLIASNFEVQEVIRKVVKDLGSKSKESLKKSFEEVVEKAFEEILTAVSKINDNMLKEYEKEEASSFLNTNYREEEERLKMEERGKEKEI